MMDVEDEVWRVVGQECDRRPAKDLTTRLFDITKPDVNRLVDILVVLEQRFDCFFMPGKSIGSSPSVTWWRPSSVSSQPRNGLDFGDVKGTLMCSDR